MTKDEADHLLFLMTAIWPTKISDPTLMVWRDKLAGLDPDIATEAVNQLADASKYWPSWAEMSEVTAAIRRRTPAPKELPVGPCLSKAEMLERVAETRAMLNR